MKLDNARIRRMYDLFSDIPWFWEVDAVTCRATQGSPYRARAVELLNVSRGSRVLDMACGTGLNFKLLQARLENTGELVGVDQSAKTLALARRRVRKQGWANVELVEQNAAEYSTQRPFDAALCTFAIEIIPPYRQALDTMLACVRPGGRLAFIGFKPSDHPIMGRLSRAFAFVGTFLGGIDLKRDIRSYAASRADEIAYEECFGGFYYILALEKPRRQGGPGTFGSSPA